MKISKDILNKVFHAYDIRGREEDGLSEDFFFALGKAFAQFLNAKHIVIGHDIRPESEIYKKAMIRGITSVGANVTDLGEIATEMMYFASGKFDEKFDGGAIITASHNPAGWNGCKLVGKKASAISENSGLKEIAEIMQNDSATITKNLGVVHTYNIYPEFKEKILSFLGDKAIPKLKLVVDAGNGVGGKIFSYVFSDLGFTTKELFFEPDGTFPNHVPDPIKEESIKEISELMASGDYDLGIAIDGDADRVFFIDKKGRRPLGTHNGVIIAKRLLQEFPGERIYYDVKVKRPMDIEIKKAGGIPLVNKTGHSFFKERMSSENGLFGAEISSHMFYRDFYFADSGMITIAIMLKLIAEGLDYTNEIDYLFEHYPISGEVNYTVNNVDEVLAKVETEFADGQISKIDGLTVEYDDWRFNLRSSNTQPLIRLNLEAKDKSIIIEKFHVIEKLINGKRDNKPGMKELE
jgi:phosphomannomutase